jgi:ABC-type dipeptide/oligopeptide/nickel transport system permease component
MRHLGPEFFWGIVLVIVFARYLDWLPPGGAASRRTAL